MIVFLSYPMNGRTRQECLNMREDLIKRIGHYDEWVDNLDCEGNEEDGRLHYLGEAIKKMDKCDAIICHPYGEFLNGCIIEREAAKLYGLKIIPYIEDGLYDEIVKTCDVYTANALFRSGYNTLSDILSLTKKDMKEIRGLGKAKQALVLAYIKSKKAE